MNVMFDTNAFDQASVDIHMFKSKQQTFTIYITSVQVEELAKIPDSRKKIRIENLQTLCSLRPMLIPTVFSFDKLNFNFFSFKTEPAYAKVIKQSKGNINDALIAATAIHENCLLVTDDIELSKRIKAVPYDAVMTYQEFKDTYLT